MQSSAISVQPQLLQQRHIGLHVGITGHHGDRTDIAIPFMAQLKCYCRYRVARVMIVEEEMNGVDYMQTAREGRSPGINAVSFLTAF